jgi:hypothetical protein
MKKLLRLGHLVVAAWRGAKRGVQNFRAREDNERRWADYDRRHGPS